MMSPPGQAAALAETRLPGNQVPQGTGVPAPSNPEVPEQGAETAASSCSIPTLAPVTFRNARGGNNRAEYHPFPRATIKEICKAHRIYGRDGPYFRGLLRADLSAEEVVPADLKYLFSCLLNSTEYILWVTAWKRLLQEALPGLLNHVNTRVDAQGNPLTLDHLAGEGQWAEATDQVVIPVQCLHVVRETALTAFFSMQTKGPAISYSKIRQDQSESFTDFVERLSRAIEAQVKNEMAREHILSEIAFSNANDLCRAAILSLPLHPKPTLPDMLQLTEGLHLKDDNWNFVTVDNSEQGTWPRVKGKLIVVGDCKLTPKEIEILPGTLDNNPGKFVLWLRCTHPPTFLPKGQTVAQIIPTWEHLEEDNIPTACPVRKITEVKPQVGWFELQEDKVQRMPPWRYLGLEIGKRTIVPQKLEIKAKIQTLADVHQLCGSIELEYTVIKDDFSFGKFVVILPSSLPYFLIKLAGNNLWDISLLSSVKVYIFKVCMTSLDFSEEFFIYFTKAWCHDHFHEEPGPVHHPLDEKPFPTSSLNLPTELEAIPSGPVSGDHRKEISVCSSSSPHEEVVDLDDISLGVLLYRLNRPSDFSHFSYSFPSISFIILMGFGHSTIA
ncbi:hypothetical protein DUI87_09284 [Hirundo rustica rustica]|uniref:Retroviral nucleocapsid Gag protein p24 C-terminal domain-containing protein n=1 Tax=Hirundo rustica rustica TaxID=333673 RepID=A0A3M0KMC6_HIRRU|nr:hypothetical protein DUI87_09284 [Hirundo rustica rustica]